MNGNLLADMSLREFYGPFWRNFTPQGPRRCPRDEYKFFWLVYRVLNGLLPFGECERKKMRKQGEDLRYSYREILIPLPRFGDFLRAIDRKDIDELQRVWPDAERELVHAMSERPRAQNDPVGAELARSVGA